MSKVNIRNIATIFLCYFLAGQLSYGQQADQILAIVNNTPITQSEYDSLYKQALLKANQSITNLPKKINPEFLQTLIDREIQFQYAQQRGITVSDKELDDLLKQFAVGNKTTVAGLFEQLEKNGISKDSFIRNLKTQRLNQILIETEVYNRIKISDQEIEYHIQSNPDIYSINQSYETAHLSILTTGLNEKEKKAKLAKALNAQQALAQEEDFKSVFIKYSEGRDAGKYGYMGWRQYDELPELFSSELQNLIPGEISDILVSNNGYHILKLLNKRGDSHIVTQNLTRRIVISPKRRNLRQDQALKLAQLIIEEINVIGDFENVAKKYSDDDLSATNGGSVGWINPGDTRSEIEQVINNLKINQVSNPIITPFGIQIIQVTDRRQKDIGIELLKKKARGTLFEIKARTNYKNLFANLRSKAYIQILDVDQ